MQEQRSRWERLKNYFAPKFKSEIILPAVVYDRCPLYKTVHRTVFRRLLAVAAPLAERTLCLYGALPGGCSQTLHPATLGSCEATVKKRSIENFQFLDRN